MYSGSLPFDSSKTMLDSLVNIYLKEGLEWLSGSGSQYESNNTTLRSVYSDNSWETAYCIIIFLKARERAVHDAIYKGDYDKRIEQAVKYLLNCAIISTSGTVHQFDWDKNPYDTGIATRSLIHYVNMFPNSEIGKDILGKEAITNAINWMNGFLISWLENRIMGEFDDVCSCVVAIIEAINCRYCHVASEAKQTISKVMYEFIRVGNTEPKGEFADSIYSNAYVQLAIMEFLRYQSEFEDKESLKRIILESLYFMESKFANNWDQPPDTAFALTCYILSAQPEYVDYAIDDTIVYMAFRWLCDQKQRYSNGSIQKSIHYTVLFLDAIIIAVESSKLNKFLTSRVDDLSDYVAQILRNRDKIERGKIGQLSLELNVHQRNETKLVAHLAATYSKIKVLILILILIVVLAVYFAFLLISSTLVITLSPSNLNISITDWKVFLAATLPLFGFIPALYRFFTQKYRKIDNIDSI